MGRFRRAATAFLEAFSAPSPEPESQVGIREAAGATVDADEYEWRKVGQRRRDLPAPTLSRAQELSLYLWRTNPLAEWMIEIRLAYLLAEAVTFQAVDSETEVQDWLDSFWADPINDLDTKFVMMVRELYLFGELALPVFVAPNGQVRLSSIDPSQIETVLMDPDNATQPIGLSMRPDAFTIKRRYRIVVNGSEEELFSMATQALRESYDDGDVFYFKIKSLSTASRGAPALTAQADWIDNFDGAMWAELERWEQLRAFLWDITMSGATEEQIKQKAQEIFAPAPGSTRVHNESEKWEAVTPELSSDDGSGFARLFRNYIIGGQGFPEHWFGGGGDVNRATAGEMDEPTLKLMKMHQNGLTAVLQTMGRFVVRMRLAVSGETYDPAKHGFKVVWPALATPDASKMANAVQAIVQAVMIAVQNDLMSDETGVQLIALAAALVGAEIDPADELEKAREDARRREADSVYGSIAADPDDEDDEDDPETMPAAG